jgi:hypothetical protein
MKRPCQYKLGLVWVWGLVWSGEGDRREEWGTQLQPSLMTHCALRPSQSDSEESRALTKMLVGGVSSSSSGGVDVTLRLRRLA